MIVKNHLLDESKVLGNSRISSWELEVAAELQVHLRVDKAFSVPLLPERPAAFPQQDLGG